MVKTKKASKALKERAATLYLHTFREVLEMLLGLREVNKVIQV